MASKWPVATIPDRMTLGDLCANAKLVADICGALGYNRIGPDRLVHVLTQEYEPEDELVHQDGAWLLPEDEE